MQTLTREEYQRYSRHILLPNIGTEGQLKLKNSKVLVVGAGGLGVPVLIYLAAAGVGHIGIVDFDAIDLSNLQRQVIYKTNEVGLLKAEQAKAFINEQNPEVKVSVFPERIHSDNAIEILTPFDLIVDGTDNFPTRYLLNDAAVLLNKPYIYGSIFRFEGQVSVFNYKTGEIYGPNYRDLFPEPPHPDLVPNCSEGGVIGILPGIVGSLQALEAIKIITGIGEVLAGKLLTIDTLHNQYKTFKFSPRKDNPINGENPSIFKLIDYEEFCNPSHLQVEEKIVSEITVQEFQNWIDEKKEFQLIDVREPYEWEIVNLDGVLIPKSQITDNISKIRTDIPVIVHCRTGKRSKEVIQSVTKSHFFNNLFNLKGGINAYASEIDSNMKIY